MGDIEAEERDKRLQAAFKSNPENYLECVSQVATEKTDAAMEQYEQPTIGAQGRLTLSVYRKNIKDSFVESYIEGSRERHKAAAVSFALDSLTLLTHGDFNPPPPSHPNLKEYLAACTYFVVYTAACLEQFRTTDANTLKGIVTTVSEYLYDHGIHCFPQLADIDERLKQ